MRSCVCETNSHNSLTSAISDIVLRNNWLISTWFVAGDDVDADADEDVTINEFIPFRSSAMSSKNEPAIRHESKPNTIIGTMHMNPVIADV